ncbi:MAG TPA: protoporphyrinogen oxidase [Longimicrobiales bacterium]
MIVIIGAGISGLALAQELDARGIPFTVYEREQRAGGVIRSELVDGHLLEYGPQRTRLTKPIRTLIDDLGIAGDVITAPADLPLMVYHSGRLRRVPFSAGALLTSDLLPLPARLRVLAEPITRGAASDETVAHYFTRKLGRAAYENLAGPLYGGLYASDPAHMVVGLSLGGTLRDLGVKRSLVMRALRSGGRVAAPAACSFRDGMATLTDALRARHASSIRIGVEVLGVLRTGAGFEVRTTDGLEHASQVVVTTPAATTAALVADFAPNAAAAIAKLQYNPLAVVHLHSTAALPAAFGYQVGFGESLMTRGVTFNDAMFGRHGVYTAYLGGAQHPDVVSWGDERIAAIAVAEFRRVTGASADALGVARAAMPAWDRSWADFAALPASPVPGLHFCANWESRPGLPGRLARARALAEQVATG